MKYEFDVDFHVYKNVFCPAHWDSVRVICDEDNEYSAILIARMRIKSEFDFPLHCINTYRVYRSHSDKLICSLTL